ncbi:MAG: hypothetical protein VKJ09_09790 [Leptolyngbya sp.]|nr:hypothetical protein [Leptolyngbya sp.]
MGFFRCSTRFGNWGKGWAIALAVTLLMAATGCASSSPQPMSPLPEPPQIEQGVPDRLTIPDLKEVLPEATATEALPSTVEAAEEPAPTAETPGGIGDRPQATAADDVADDDTPVPTAVKKTETKSTEAKSTEAKSTETAPPTASMKPHPASEPGVSAAPKETPDSQAPPTADQAELAPSPDPQLQGDAPKPQPTASTKATPPTTTSATATPTTAEADSVEVTTEATAPVAEGAQADQPSAKPAMVQPNAAADAAMQALETNLLGTTTASDGSSAPPNNDDELFKKQAVQRVMSAVNAETDPVQTSP